MSLRVALLQIDDPKHPTVYGDFAGGFGAGFIPGKSLLSRAVSFAKHHGIDLPLMSFGYLAAIFRDAGHDVVATVNRTVEADLVIIHSSLMGWQEQVRLGRKMMQRSRVGFIGPFAGVEPGLFLQGGHFVIRGEPEAAAARLAAGERLDGLIDSPPVVPLDALPYPDWHPFNFLRFSYFPSLVRRPVFPMLASRGCPDRCVYCPYKVQYSKFRARAVEDVVAEMRFLKQHARAAGFLFRDPFFSFSRKRTEQLSRLIIEAGIRRPWVCETKIDSLDEDLILLMKRAGLTTINVGIESANDGILDAAGRTHQQLDRTRQLMRFCNKHHVKTAAFFILGWPDDTRASMQATIDLACELNPHIATFTLFTPFPGTPAYETYRDRLLTDDWRNFDVMNVVFDHPHLTAEELLAIKEQAYVRFYYRPRYITSFVRRMLA